VKVTLYPVALSLLVACGGGTYSQPNKDDFGDLDTADTGGDTQDTQDTGDTQDTQDTGDTQDTQDTGDTEDTGGGGSSLDACINPYDPVNVRNGYREYDVMLGGAFAGTSTQENFGEAYTSDGEDAYDVYEEMNSDAGVWTVDIFVTCRGTGSQTGMFYAEWQSPNGGSPPSAAMRYLPAEADMGSVGSWTYSFSTSVTTDFGDIDVDASGTIEEIGFERVVLFDGASFNAYHVRNTLHEDIVALGSAYPQDAIIDSWYVKGLGLVRETIENTTDGTMVLTRELTGYGEFSPE
jgi:hypothetical protein